MGWILKKELMNPSLSTHFTFAVLNFDSATSSLYGL